MSMKMKTVSATVPADVKAEVVVVLAARGISMAALVRELLARVATRDAETMAWLNEAPGLKPESVFARAKITITH